MPIGDQMGGERPGGKARYIDDGIKLYNSGGIRPRNGAG